MKNSKNKFVAGIVCGLVMGSIGTSFVGNFQASGQQVALNYENNVDDSQSNIDNSEGNMPSNGQMPEFSQGEMPQMQGGMNGGRGGKGGHHQGQGSLEATDSVDVSSGQYSDGTYQGSAPGYAQGLTVQVKISSGKISNIQITNHNETPGFYESAFETVPSEIIQKQSTDVDTVSGATYSSVGIINAVNNALSQAGQSQSTDNTSINSNLETQSQ